MRRYKFALIACAVYALIINSVFAQQDYIIKGKIADKSLEGTTIRLNYNDSGFKIDTAVVISGAFEIKGRISQPVAALLYTHGSRENLELFIDKKIINIKGKSIASATVAGGADQKKFVQLRKSLKEHKQISDQLTIQKYKAMKEKDSVALNRIKVLIAERMASIDSLEKIFIARNPASHLSLRLLEGKIHPTGLATEKEALEKLYTGLNENLKNTPVGKLIQKKLDIANKFAPGKPAIDFTLNDTLGQPISLSSFRGKYVLLDFWASWCLPCRAETPHLAKAYERFKDKGFTILAVSLDIERFQKAWREAIRNDKMTWPQVCDPTSGEKSIAKIYGITNIPMNYLLDPNGIIIATSLRGEEVSKRLEEIFSADELH